MFYTWSLCTVPLYYYYQSSSSWPLALGNTSEEATPITHTAMVMISFLHNLHPIASDQTFVLCLLCHLLLVLT